MTRLIKEKKYVEYQTGILTKYAKECSHNFILFNDGTTIVKDNLEKIKNEINKFDYDVTILDEKNFDIPFLIDNLNMIDFDTIVTIGTGGKLYFDKIKNLQIFRNKNVINVTWHRVWNNKKLRLFETDINEYNFENKNLLIIEDVIASGNTLWTFYDEIQKKQGFIKGICCYIIQECSPLIHNSFIPIFANYKIKNNEDESLDPFWFPPIYSFRHLLYGDEEDINFYKTFNNKYFKDNKKIELLIKDLRKK